VALPRLTVAMSEPNRMHTDRVQVSYLFKGQGGSPAGTGYPGVKTMAPLVLAACPNQHGAIAGNTGGWIFLPDIEGALTCMTRLTDLA